jgi:hypothetical protein
LNGNREGGLTKVAHPVVAGFFPAGETSLLESRIIKLTSTANKYKNWLSIFACSIFVIAQKRCAPTNIPSNKIAM